MHLTKLIRTLSKSNTLRRCAISSHYASRKFCSKPDNDKTSVTTTTGEVEPTVPKPIEPTIPKPIGEEEFATKIPPGSITFKDGKLQVDVPALEKAGLVIPEGQEPDIVFDPYMFGFMECDHELKNVDVIPLNEPDVDVTTMTEAEYRSVRRFQYPQPKIRFNHWHKSKLQIIKEDIRHFKKFLMDPKNNNFLRVGTGIPWSYDILIIGAGCIGTSIAYFIQEFCRRSVRILVIDKDLSPDCNLRFDKLEEIPCALSLGNITQQFSLKENIELSKFGVDFIRNIDFYTDVIRDDSLQRIPFQPFGHLTLARKQGEELLKKNHMTQRYNEIHNELLTGFQLSERFPWLKTEDIELGCHGLQDEGWIDPQIYLRTLRMAAKRYGTFFVEGQPLEFVFREVPVHNRYFSYDAHAIPQHVTVLLSDGTLRQFEFGIGIIALGVHTKDFCKNLLHMNSANPGIFGWELPVEARKRYVYCFEGPPECPPLGSPLIIDPSGLWVRRVGITDYICGLPPIPEEEPRVTDLNNFDVDYEFFYQRVWPILVNRIPAFETIKLKAGWATYFDYNTFDNNGLLGPLPAHFNMYVAAGFGERSILHSAGIGRGVKESIYDGVYKSINLRRFLTMRVMDDEPIFESYYAP